MSSDNIRQRMVEYQLRERGVLDPLVLAAFETVKRERFVPPEFHYMAYRDRPLPIGFNQTISQPYIVALMTEALRLKGSEHVLEVGTGSGYAAAILAEIAKTVVTIERVEELATLVRNRLRDLKYDNVTAVCGDGTVGYPDLAPYDAIVVTAGGPKVPPTLCHQLKIGGRLVIPVGPDETTQDLIRVTRESQHSFREENLCPVRFVPLLGVEGWHENALLDIPDTP